jgi:hypothetical protein
MLLRFQILSPSHATPHKNDDIFQHKIISLALASGTIVKHSGNTVSN